MNLGQRHAFGDGLIEVHEELPDDAGEGSEHAHRRVLIPHQPPGQGDKRRLLGPNRLDRQGGQLRRVGGHDHGIPVYFGLGNLGLSYRVAAGQEEDEGCTEVAD